uniref:Uncharacterized protein n=1 Tax=Anguilla anguilla TaxID=7936 RepID=A0A0E9Q4I7_ANGAN
MVVSGKLISSPSPQPSLLHCSPPPLQPLPPPLTPPGGQTLPLNLLLPWIP